MDNTETMNNKKAEEYERTLIVSHLSDDFDEDKVRHIFKRGKNGGEEIEKVTSLSRDKGIILLQKTDAIDRILNKEKEIKDMGLEVKRVSAQDLDELQKKLNMSRKVLISGFHKEIKINTVYIYCQKKRNDGGKVEQVNLEGGKAFVVFEDVQVAQKFANKTQKLQGKQLQVNLIIDEKPGCVVKVEGLPDGVTEYTIAIHFQKKRNGGGEIEEVMLGPAKNEAIVIFKESEVAACAASQSHKMEGKTITVKLYDIKLDELNKIMNRNRRTETKDKATMTEDKATMTEDKATMTEDKATMTEDNALLNVENMFLNITGQNHPTVRSAIFTLIQKPFLFDIHIEGREFFIAGRMDESRAGLISEIHQISISNVSESSTEKRCEDSETECKLKSKDNKPSNKGNKKDCVPPVTCEDESHVSHRSSTASLVPISEEENNTSDSNDGEVSNTTKNTKDNERTEKTSTLEDNANHCCKNNLASSCENNVAQQRSTNSTNDNTKTSKASRSMGASFPGQ